MLILEVIGQCSDLSQYDLSEQQKDVVRCTKVIVEDSEEFKRVCAKGVAQFNVTSGYMVENPVLANFICYHS